MSNQSIDTLLTEAAEKIRAEAYAAGWRDAIAALNKTVSELGDPASTNNENPNAGPEPTISLISRASNTRMPKQGSTPWVVVQAVKKRPGMTSAQIVETVRESGHSAPEASIRTSIFRVKDRNFIVPRHGKWYPA